MPVLMKVRNAPAAVDRFVRNHHAAFTRLETDDFYRRRIDSFRSVLLLSGEQSVVIALLIVRRSLQQVLLDRPILREHNRKNDAARAKRRLTARLRLSGCALRCKTQGQRGRRCNEMHASK